ncbi:type II toxin-antitoxin system VapC family toxin [Methylobacterium nonmethylotrophicum]|uniref:PIN domain-containing protein n=1 Tax=Methylobacterium nonmethylotrophicum TaxID=1141884 RepID=A0A4Z0NUP7_9HYPH|nr:type II toxin-antitoxin system VapC family toxin [Methylobacterium nonmethylotrophicum]TGE01003.1 PIN domain-containing protein [Methylobacterium nonmethylotrophicum]
MTSVLLDTHAWAWTLTGDDRLSSRAAAAIEAADQVFVSAISFFEIAQTVRLGKWPEIEPYVTRLVVLLSEQGGVAIALDPEICAAAAAMAWTHRDPFDRLLAATAQHHRLPLISADLAFDGIVARVW